MFFFRFAPMAEKEEGKREELKESKGVSSCHVLSAQRNGKETRKRRDERGRGRSREETKDKTEGEGRSREETEDKTLIVFDSAFPLALPRLSGMAKRQRKRNSKKKKRRKNRKGKRRKASRKDN